jgi:hypothetical protein
LPSTRYRDREQARQKEAEAERSREQRLEDLRRGVLRRVVRITNVVRRAAILIRTDPSVETCDEQMRRIVEALLDVRLLIHKVNAAGPIENRLFPRWRDIRERLEIMHDYLDDMAKEWGEVLGGAPSKAVTDAGLRSTRWRFWHRRRLPDAWQQLTQCPRIGQMLHHEPADQTSEFFKSYLSPYQDAMKWMMEAFVAE